MTSRSAATFNATTRSYGRFRVACIHCSGFIHLQLSSVHRAVLIPVLALGAFCNPLRAPCRAQEANRLAHEILKKWSERPVNVTSLQVTWERESTTSPDSIKRRVGRLKRLNEANSGESGAGPSSDFRDTMINRLAIDGKRMSWRARGTGLTATDNVRQYEVDSHTVFDGVHSTAFGFQEESAGSRFPQAVLGTDDEVFRTEELYPILMSVYPLAHGLTAGFDPSALPVTTATARISDLECICLKAGRRIVWVAPEANFAIMKYTILQEDLVTPFLETTISEGRHEGPVFVPMQWHTTLLGKDGTIEWTLSAKVSDLKINAPIDDSEFRVSLPPGTVIIDLAKPNATEIIAADGSRVSISDARSYREAQKAAVTVAAERQAGAALMTTRKWILLANIALVVSAALYIALRKRTLRAKSVQGNRPENAENGPIYKKG